MATAPTEAVKNAARLLPPGRALDLACGTGRHAIWLAGQGWTVTAVDRNEEAIAELSRTCPQIDARVVDLEQSTEILQPESYDLIVCWLYHQTSLYPLIRQAIRPGGIAALCALRQGRFAANPGELRAHFPSWVIIHHTEVAHGPEKMAEELIVQNHLR